MARGSGSVRAKRRKNRPSFSFRGIGGGQGNRIAKGRYKNDAKKDSSKDDNKNFAKNPAGTTVESQLKYFSDPENRRKLNEAVSKFRGTNKKEDDKKSNNLVKKASVTKGGTKSLGKTTNNKTNDTSKKTTETKPLKAKTFKEFMAEKGGGQKVEVPDLVSKSKPTGQTKRQQRRATREDRVAKRRAGKTAIRNFKQGKATDQAQFDANVEAEKDLIRKRRAGRRQFLRNFASQLTTGENAPAQPRDFKGRKEDFYNNQSTTANEGDKAETEQNTNQFMDLLNTTSNDNSNFNNLLTPSTKPDPGNFLGTTNISDLYKPGEFAVSPTLKVEEDSTPISAMRKEYNKKRGL